MDVYKVLSEVDDCPKEVWVTVCKVALGVLARDGRWTVERLPDGELAKRLYGAMAAFGSDMARMDAGGSQVRSSLEELGVSDSTKVDVFADAFRSAKATIRIALGKTFGVALPQLVDMEWRLDYVVRSSDPTNPNPLVPIYYVKLVVAKPQPFGSDKTLETIDLALTVEQMHDFLLTIRDANHQAARIAGGGRKSS